MGSRLVYPTKDASLYGRSALMEALGALSLTPAAVHIGAGRIIIEWSTPLTAEQKTAVTNMLAAWAPLIYGGDMVRHIADVDRVMRKQINEAVGGLSPVDKQIGWLFGYLKDLSEAIKNSTSHSDLVSRVTAVENAFPFFTTLSNIQQAADTFKANNNITT